MKNGLKALLMICLFTSFGVAHAALNINTGDELKSLGNPKAPKGGTLYFPLNSEPPTLNPYTYTDVYASLVHDYVIDNLMIRNIDTYEWEPFLAESVVEGPEGSSYTFKMRKGAKFHDGKPVTAADVKFSFDAIRNPEYGAARWMPYFENVKNAEVLDKYTIRFNIKQKYFNNFNVLAGMLPIVPKHAYGDPKKKMNKKLVGSGPYKLEKGNYKKGKSIQLTRNKDWWGAGVPHLSGRYKYDRVFFRFVKSDDLQLEKLKKGQLDFLGLNPEMYVKKAVGKEFGKTILKKKVVNKDPKGYGFLAWNLKKDMFNDKKVRRALAHLMNRDLMIEKFQYEMALPATGPWYQQSPYANPSVKPIPFNPKTAQKMLAEAGWKDSNKDGVLDRNVKGKRQDFRFTLLLPSRDSEKYFTIYKEDLKKAGIVMDIKLVEWNTFLKSLDEKNFDAVTLAWSGGSVDNDPKQIWHSDSAREGGSNFISYSNPKVDQLIELGRKELDRQKRIGIYKKIYKLIAEDAPYVFLFNQKFSLYAHNKRVKMVKDTYQYDTGRMYWWLSK